MDFTPWEYALMMVGSIVAGMINTVAGSGSVLTLSLLTFMGLPANVANGTNRLGVLAQGVIGMATFRKEGQFETKGLPLIIGPAVIGGIAGTMLAVVAEKEALETALGLLMVLMLFLILLNPKRLIRKKPGEAKPSAFGKVLSIVLSLFIGLYAGFIQAGVGILIIMTLTLTAGYDFVTVNPIKLLIVVTVNILAFGIFIYHGQVEWVSGAVMAVGQSIGAFFSARFASRHPKAQTYIRYVLILIILISIVRFLHLDELFLKWI